jgi:putative ABC transport system permease protein
MGHELRYAVRTLRGSPGFSLAVVLTLTVAIGANTIVFGIVKAVFLDPLPYPAPERLVVLWQSNSRTGSLQQRVSPANFADWRAQNRVFAEMGFYPAWGGSRSFRLAGSDGPERVAGAYASSGLFRALGVKPLLGRTFLPDEDHREGDRVALLGYSLWQRRFGGSRDVLGRTLTVDTYGLRTYTIVGGMPSGFDFPDRAQVWLPSGWMGVTVPEPGASVRCCSWLMVVARLEQGVAVEQAQAQMSTIARRLLAAHPDSRESPEVTVVPMLEQSVGAMRRSFLLVGGSVLFVLLIAAANVASLLLARAAARQKEYVIRAVLGASRARILRQSLIESVLLASIGGAAGVAAAFGGLKLIVAAAGSRVPRLTEASIDLPVLAFTAGVSVLTGVLFGVAPGWHASRTALGVRGWARRVAPARAALVVLEIALATMLAVCAALLVQSLHRLTRVDPGFRAENLVTARFDMTSRSFSNRIRPREFFRDLMERMRGLPGVVAVGGASMLPLADAGPAGQPITQQERGFLPAADSPTAKTGGATPDYFRALGVPLLRGRFFTESDGAQSPLVVILNDTMARRYWPGEDPIGRRVVLGSRERQGRVRAGSGNEPDWMQVVGVVGDMRGRALDAEPRPELYLPYWQWPWYEVDLVVRTSGDPAAAAAALRREARQLDRDALITEVRMMEEILDGSVAQPRFRAWLLGAFAGAALLLAAIGIYGVTAYSTRQRTREIGIRMALGALPASVLRMVVLEAVRLAALGAAIGLAGSVAAGRLLSALLYGVSATSWPTFTAVALLLAAIAVGAAFMPARRAAQVDPLAALRQE